MELIHAYPAAKLQRANTATFQAAGQMIPGTRVLFSLPAAGWGLTIAADKGIDCSFARDTITMSMEGGVDPARTESYWVTCGWKWTSRQSVSVPAQAVYLGTTPLATPDQIFALAGGVVGQQIAYTEIAYNPITKEIRVYVNGNRLPGSFTHNGSVLSAFVSRNVAYSVSAYVSDIYVGRFEGNEEPRLRRWKMEMLAPVTNGIGANIDKTDGQVVSLQGTELVATYNIPANTLAVAVELAAESVNNASDVTTRITDGTTTVNKRSTGFNGPLGTQAGTGTNPYDFRGNGLPAGQIKPAAGATTLTVGIKAIDRT